MQFANIHLEWVQSTYKKLRKFGISSFPQVLDVFIGFCSPLDFTTVTLIFFCLLDSSPVACDTASGRLPQHLKNFCVPFPSLGCLLTILPASGPVVSGMQAESKAGILQGIQI